MKPTDVVTTSHSSEPSSPNCSGDPQSKNKPVASKTEAGLEESNALTAAREEARCWKAEAAALQASCQAVLEIIDFRSAAEKIFESCKNLIGATAGFVALISEDGKGKEVLFIDVGGERCAVDADLPKPIRGMWAETQLQKKAVWHNDFTSSEWNQLVPAGHIHLGNVMSIPLILEGQTIGVLSLANKPGGFTDHDATKATAFGEIATIALRTSRTARSLEKSEEKFRTLFEHAGDAILIHDLDGLILEANDEACQRLGFGHDELLELRVGDLEAVSDRPGVLERVQTLGSEEKMIFDSVFISRIGDAVPIEVSARRVGFDGQAAVLILLRDVSERLQAAEEKDRLESTLLHAQKMESIGRLAGGVAHDFNNLLSPIIGYADMILSDMDSRNPLNAPLKVMLDAAEHARKLTQQLLAYCRKQVLETKVVNLPELLQSSLKMLHRTIREDVKLEVYTNGAQSCVRVDLTQIEQVLINLMVNAQDAMPRGGTIVVETNNIEFDAMYCQSHGDIEPGPYVMLSISDTGRGMDPVTMRQIFEPFFTRKDCGKGTGLGLSTVHGIVKQHGGSIDVFSQPNLGTTFKIYLPRVVAGEEAEENPAQPGEAICGHETILVVEDNLMVRNLVRDILNKFGYKVLVASHGREAVQIAERYHGPIDLLITDVIMPGMSGHQAYQEIAAMQPHIDVLFISGHGNKVIAHHGINCDEAHFLPKPFAVRDLTLTVRSILDRRRPQVNNDTRAGL